MKKLITFVAVLLLAGLAYGETFTPITVDTFVSPDDVTIAHLENFRATVVNRVNSLPGGALRDESLDYSKCDADLNPHNFRNEAFNDWCYTGLLPSVTSGTLVGTLPTGTAYINGWRVTKDNVNKTFTATKYTYVDLKYDGTYTYSETAIGAAEPAVTASSIRICRVSTDGSELTNIRDDRIMAITLDSAQEDFEYEGLRITVTTPDIVNIAPGVVYNGTVRINKTAATELKLSTAGDWVTGGGGRSNSTYGFVVVSPLAALRLTTTAPTLHDNAGNTAGTLRYSSIAGTNWRVVGWFYMNAAGGGNIDYDWGNCPDNGNPNIVVVSMDNNVTTTSTSFVDLTDMDIDFYSFGGVVDVTFVAPFQTSTQSTYLALDVDGTDEVTSIVSSNQSGTWRLPGVMLWGKWAGQGGKRYKIQWKEATDTAYQNGKDDGARVLMIQER